MILIDMTFLCDEFPRNDQQSHLHIIKRVVFSYDIILFILSMCCAHIASNKDICTHGKFLFLRLYILVHGFYTCISSPYKNIVNWNKIAMISNM